MYHIAVSKMVLTYYIIIMVGMMLKAMMMMVASASPCFDNVFCVLLCLLWASKMDGRDCVHGMGPSEKKLKS